MLTQSDIDQATELLNIQFGFDRVEGKRWIWTSLNDCVEVTLDADQESFVISTRGGEILCDSVDELDDMVGDLFAGWLSR